MRADLKRVKSTDLILWLYFARAVLLQDCNAAPDTNPYKAYKDNLPVWGDERIRYHYTTLCGLPAYTVTLTPPVPDTCYGAAVCMELLERYCWHSLGVL